MPEIKGTKTEKNLMEAFAGRHRHATNTPTLPLLPRRKGIEIAAFFLETAENKKEHAKLHLKRLGGIGSTVENLKEAAAGRT